MQDRPHGGAKFIGLSSPAWDPWRPVLNEWATTNERVHQAWRDMSAEWQRFIGRRLDEDFHLLQKTSSATGPDQIWNAWMKFWQKAAADYAAQYWAIAKCAGGSVESTPTGQTGSGADTPAAGRQSKAA